MSTGGREHRKKETPAFREMTPAHVRESAHAEFAEVMFLESARIYKLFKNNAKYQEIMRALRKAAASNRSVRVLLNLPHGDVIEDVKGTG